MRKITIYILSCFLLAVACEKDYTIETYNLGTEFSITGSMTSLDNQVVVSIDNPKQNLTSIDVVLSSVYNPVIDGDTLVLVPDLGDISVSAGVGTITYTNAQLQLWEQDGEAHLMLNSTFNGKAINRAHTVTVASPFTTEDPGVTNRDDTTFKYTYAVEPVIATVSTVTIQTKVGENGTYADLAGSWNAIDTISITGADYNVADTLFIKIEATAGTKTDTEVSKLVISPVSVESTTSFPLDFVANFAYDLIESMSVDVATAGDSADIELTTTDISGGFNIGFESNNNAEFVVVTSAEYDAGDKLFLSEQDFTGAFQSVASVTGGETYAYRTRRGSGDWNLGYIKVVKVDKPQGVQSASSVEFEYKK